MSYPRLWSRVYNTPLLIHPDKAKVIEAVFRQHLSGEKSVALMEDDDGPSPEELAAKRHENHCRAYAGLELQHAPDKPYALTKTGVALVPVLGTLVQRGSWLDSMSGLTSYDTVASMLDRAMSDPDVRAVMFEVDSPGGEAAGLMDLAGRMYAARQKKPTWAHANEQAYSAGYWFASGAQRVYTPQTGGVGSIGAVMLHVDQSKRDSMMGYSYTFIHSGAHKVDGNSHQAPNKAVLKWAQSEVDRYRGMFAQAVATHRGISADAVLATEAALLTPAEAQEGGYIDGVMTLLEAVTLLEAELRQPSSTGARMAAGPSMQANQKETQMKMASPAATLVLAALSISMESVSDANGALLEKTLTDIVDPRRTEAKAEGAKTGRAEGITTERARVGAILGCEEAKGRANLALHLALQTDTDVDAAKKLLAAASKEVAGAQMFAAAMGNLANPNLGVDGDRSATETTARIDAPAIFAARRNARGAAAS